jgi:phosphomannomutase
LSRHRECEPISEPRCLGAEGSQRSDERVRMEESPLMLSVSGLRGLVGKSLTPPLAARYAAAFGQWLKSRHPEEDPTPHVMLGRDSRPSGQMLELAAASGLISVGCRVTTLGIVTTPGVAIMTEHLHADGGMVITASHNPILWNGIKALRPDGVAPPPDQAQQIIDCFKADDVTYAPVERLAPLGHDETTHHVHIDRVLRHIDVDAIRKRQLKVVVDSVHGAGGNAAAMLMDRLGIQLIHVHAQPTGLFPHPPEPTRENLVGLCEAVQKHHADLGFAQDPDADRLAIIDDQGRYIGEEYTLALASLHVLNNRDQPQNAVLVANLSTSRMIDDIAHKAGAQVIRTPVGEANVAATIRDHSAVIGGEGNGGVIWPQVIHVRDSIVGMSLVLELLAHRRLPLSQIALEIPRYAIVKDKVNIKANAADAYIEKLKSHFSSQKIDTQDGVRIDWPDKWIHVRSSNTEPILRIIAEADTEEHARLLVNQARDLLKIT